MQQDARIDATGVDAEATGGEESVGLLIGADRRNSDSVGTETGSQQLQPVALRQVDVPSFR